jgi:hypothetical protein
VFPSTLEPRLPWVARHPSPNGVALATGAIAINTPNANVAAPNV